jgi:hypothetical protein
MEAAEAFSLTHLSISDAELNRVLQAEDKEKYALAYLLTERQSYSLQFLIAHIEYPRPYLISQHIGACCTMTDAEVRTTSPEMQAKLLRYMTCCQTISADLLMERKDLIDVSDIGMHPKCNEMLEDPELLARFFAADRCEIMFLSPDFFKKHPEQLEPPNVDKYWIYGDSPELTRLLLPILTERYRLWTPDVVSEMITQSRGIPQNHMYCTDHRQFLRTYFSNHLLDIPFYLAHSHLIPLDYKLLSRHPELPVDFILETLAMSSTSPPSGGLDMVAVMQRNNRLPGWLMRRALFRQLGLLD